jgi:hypothetical protein
LPPRRNSCVSHCTWNDAGALTAKVSDLQGRVCIKKDTDGGQTCIDHA